MYTYIRMNKILLRNWNLKKPIKKFGDNHMIFNSLASVITET